MSLRSGARVVAFYRFLHATISQQILANEQDMATWLAQHLPEAVEEIIRQKAAAH